MLRTERLLLRQWRDDDFEAWAAMGQDREVMEYFPTLLDRDAARAIMTRIRSHFDGEGFGLWAIEIPGGAPFVGFCGLQRVPFEAHFTPAVEVGWRLAREAWGKGYATEAARASIEYGFDVLGLQEIVAMVVPANTRSRRVCERLGMTTDPADDFDNPRGDVPRLRRLMLYRVRRGAQQPGDGKHSVGQERIPGQPEQVRLEAT